MADRSQELREARELGARIVAAVFAEELPSFQDHMAMLEVTGDPELAEAFWLSVEVMLQAGEIASGKDPMSLMAKQMHLIVLEG